MNQNELIDYGNINGTYNAVPIITNGTPTLLNNYALYNVQQLPGNNMPFLIDYTDEQKAMMNQQMFQLNMKIQYEKNQCANMARLQENEYSLKAMLEDKRALNRFVSRLEREESLYGIYEDSEGFLCKELLTPDGKKISSKRICTKRHLRMREYCSFHKEKHRVFEIVWDECHAEDKLFLREDKLSGGVLSAKLISGGVSIQTAREYKRNLMDLVLSYLIEHAERIELPWSFGWNLTTEGWLWVSDEAETMQEVVRHAM